MFADELADARLIVNDQDLCHRTDSFHKIYDNSFIVLQN